MLRNSTPNALRAELPALPHYADAELASRSVPELLAMVIKDEDRVPRNVIDELAKRGAETMRMLRARLESNEFWSRQVSDGEWWLRLHAVMIPGLMPDAEAGEIMVAAMRRMSEEDDDSLQGWFAGFWPALFRNKPDSLSDPLRALSEDRKVDWYMRSNAAETVIALAARHGAAPLDDALAWLARIVADETEDWDMRLCSANTLLDFPRAAYRSLLENLADRQKKPDIHFARKEVEEAYAAGEDKPEWQRFEDPWQFYTPEAIAARQERWAKEDAEAEYGAERDSGYIEDDELMTYVRHEPKIGRNDPCPCGSGKKYKKCHGAPGASPLLH